jgi:hypothetical protein
MRRRGQGTALIVKRLVTGVVAVFVLSVTCVLPFVVHDDAYGDVPIPGSGTVHLLPGEVDVTLRSQRPDDGADAIPVPLLSLRISGLDGNRQPEVIESRHAKCVNNDCDIRTRVWIVRVLREADYHVIIDGEVYGPYQPTLTFGHFVWNDFLLALLALGSALRWLVFIVAAVAVVLWLVARLLVAVVPTLDTSAPPTAEPGDLPRADQLRPDRAAAAGVHDRPAQELVLPYPERRGRVGKSIFFVLFSVLLVGGPVVGIYSWCHLPGDAPVSWTPVVVLVGLGAGFGWILGRVVVRWAVTRTRRARGDGWLRLSSTGFEVHERSGKPHRYEWCEIDEFVLVETRDEEGGVVPHVGLRFSPERESMRANKIWEAIPPRRHRDETSADRHVDGYWDGPLDEAVDLMNEWLTHYKTARDLEPR